MYLTMTSEVSRTDGRNGCSGIIFGDKAGFAKLIAYKLHGMQCKTVYRCAFR